MSLTVAIVDLESTLPNLTSQFLMPRHGVLSVGTALRRNGFEVRVYVECLNGVSFEQLVGQDVVGASVTAPNYNRVQELFQRLKRARPEIILIAGGPHSTISPRSVLTFADIAVRDEAENTIVELLTTIDSGDCLSNVDGISFHKDGSIKHTARRPYMVIDKAIEDLTLLQGYDPPSGIRQMIRGARTCALINTSRGCPFTCSFCFENMIGGTGFRTKSIESLIDDIKQKRDFFGTNRFWLADSNFGTNPSHTETVLQAIIDAKLDCQFTSLCRVELGGRPRLLDLMRKAGFVTVSIGMEALDDDRLKSIEKRQSLSQIRQAISEIHNRNIAVFGLFMVGFDGDTEQTPWEIVEFCKRESLEGLSIYCLTEYPELPGRTLPRHRIFENNLDYHSGHFVTTFPKNVKPSILEKSVFDSLKSFYSMRRNTVSLLKRDWHALRFGVPLWLQVRKMEKLSMARRAFMQKIEEPYYDTHGNLMTEKLTANPVTDSVMADDPLAQWDDALEENSLPDNIDLLVLEKGKKQVARESFVPKS